MTGTVFYKMTGSGNDFVVLDGRHTSPAEWPVERIVRLCDRRMGVGADGLVFLTPEGRGLRMVYLNNDGGRVELCGNAALCCTRLAAYLELAVPEGMQLLTDAGALHTRCVGGSAANLAELRFPAFTVGQTVDIPRAPGESGIFLGAVGVPHLVVVTDDAHAVDLSSRGRELRWHPAAGPGGANVNFVSPPRAAGDLPSPDGAWTIRTFERGIEGETLACGTGTVASAFALAAHGRNPLPAEFVTSLGIRLAVSGQIEGEKGIDAWLMGEGRLVYRGILANTNFVTINNTRR